MSNIVQSSSCRCLNVRFFAVGNEVSKVVVTHPRLIDIFLKTGEGSRIHLACFLCGVLLFDCQWSPDRLDDRRTTVEFRHAAFESVTMPGTRVNLSTTRGWLTDAQRLVAANSPAFSSTFRVLLSHMFDRPPTNGEESPLLDTYPEQLLQVISDLCDVVITRSLRLCANLLVHQHQDVETQVDIAHEEQTMRSEFRILCKVLWDRHDKGKSSESDSLFDDAIQPYLARIDANFRETRTATTIPNVPATVDSDLVAMTLEGLSSDRFTGVQQQAPCKSTADRGPTFNSLPTETVWKILDFLRPSYFPIDILSANAYCVECSAFAQLMLVSKSWSEMVLPILYNTVVLFANPESLNKLSFALESHGDLVRTIIIDDVGLGLDHDIHIQACWRYIDKCFQYSTNLLRVECYGDYQVELHDFPKSGSQNQIHTLILRLPLWLPFNVSRVLTLPSSSLEHLEISQWNTHALQPALDPITCPSLPKCRTIDLQHSNIGEGDVAALLSLAAVDGKSSLRSLSITDMVSLHPPAILSLLRINEISTHLSTLRIQLAHGAQHDDGNDFPIQVLPLCPSLVEFSYTSPASVEVFQYLPPSLRALELAVILPQVHTINSTPNPSLSSVEPFITYIASDRAANLERLSVVRRVNSTAIDTPFPWIRLDTQQWDDQGELRALCKRKHVQFDCAFSLV